MKNILRSYLSVFVLAVGFVSIASAQTSPSITDFPNVKVKNFGKMDENFYRGAQPEKDDYKSLADMGIKTIIDLRNDPTDYEKTEAEAAGLKYVNIRMSGFKTPKEQDLAQFLSLVNDPETGTVFVHCKAGIHRTGVAGAVYRFTKYGWNYDQVYKEMKNYNFYTGLWHGAIKDYVEDYAEKMEKTRNEAKVAVVAAASAVPALP
jgi:protein tyrosine/serine phosphatase